MPMRGKTNRDYTVRHQKITEKLMQMCRESDSGCFAIPRIASELGMDQRTVRAHLKILEIHRGGIFLDPEERQFCTKEGLVLLAQRLGLDLCSE